MYSLSLQEHFQNVREISDTVNEYLATEQYILDFGPDDFTPKNILFNCYDILLSDLKSIGITVGFPYGGDLLMCGYIYLIRKYIEDIPQLLTPELADRLETILTDTESPIDMFETIRKVINSDKFEHTELDYISSEIYASDTFVSFMKEQLRTYKEQKEYIFSFDIARSSAYLEKTRKLRELARKYTYIIVNNLKMNLNTGILEKLLRDYDLDKISPRTIHIYALVDTEEVPPSIYNLAKQKMQEHHERSHHHIEYWIDPKKNPRPIPLTENLVLMVAHHVEIDTTRDEFDEAVENMIEKGRSIFNEQMISLIDKMKNIVLENWGE